MSIPCDRMEAAFNAAGFREVSHARFSWRTEMLFGKIALHLELLSQKFWTGFAAVAITSFLSLFLYFTPSPFVFFLRHSSNFFMLPKGAATARRS